MLDIVVRALSQVLGGDFAHVVAINFSETAAASLNFNDASAGLMADGFVLAFVMPANRSACLGLKPFGKLSGGHVHERPEVAFDVFVAFLVSARHECLADAMARDSSSFVIDDRPLIPRLRASLISSSFGGRPSR